MKITKVNGYRYQYCFHEGYTLVYANNKVWFKTEGKLDKETVKQLIKKELNVSEY